MKNYQKIRNQLNPKELVVLDELLDNHFKHKTCGCSEHEFNIHTCDDGIDINMCPIGLYEDGCTNEDLIMMIRELVEIDEED